MSDLEDIAVAIVCGILIYLVIQEVWGGCACNNTKREMFGRRPLISPETWEGTTLADMDEFDSTYGDRAGYWGQPVAGGGWNTPNLRPSSTRLAKTNLVTASSQELRDVINSALMDFR